MPAPAKILTFSSPRTAGDVEMPTHQIPADCMCSWSVSKPGPGTKCVSVLRYRNALCPVRHRPAVVNGDG